MSEASIAPQQQVCDIYNKLRSTYWSTVLNNASTYAVHSPTSSSIDSPTSSIHSPTSSSIESSTSSSHSPTSSSTHSPRTSLSSLEHEAPFITAAALPSPEHIYHQHAPPLPPSPTLSRLTMSPDDPTSNVDQDRPHPCPICPARFRQRSHLTAHYRVVHYKCKPFICNYCKHSFGKKYDLKMHVAAVHFRLRAFTCDQCNKSFAKKSNLSRHRNHRHPNTISPQ